jgi:hypothetical protein
VQASASPRRLLGLAPLATPGCPGHGAAPGLDAGAFVALLAQLLPGLTVWEAWDVWGALENADGARVPCRQLVLVTALVASTAAGQQPRALHAFGAAIHSAFAAGPAPLRGLRTAARLLGAPAARLHSAAAQLGLCGARCLRQEVRHGGHLPALAQQAQRSAAAGRCPPERRAAASAPGSGTWTPPGVRAHSSFPNPHPTPQDTELLLLASLEGDDEEEQEATPAGASGVPGAAAAEAAAAGVAAAAARPVPQCGSAAAAAESAGPPREPRCCLCWWQ